MQTIQEAGVRGPGCAGRLTLSGWRGALARMIEARAVQTVLIALILVNAAVLGLETYPWAMAGFGRYQYARAHGEIDRAFDRMASWLRRPASYGLRFDTSSESVPPPAPGSLAVVAPEEADGTRSAVIGPDVAVEIVLDTSGSMLERFGGERRIDIAKRVLADLVRRDLPTGLPDPIVRHAARCTAFSAPLA